MFGYVLCASVDESVLTYIFIFVWGHRDKVVDFHWNASDPWTVVSVSDDCARVAGGGTVQVSDLKCIFV